MRTYLKIRKIILQKLKRGCLEENTKDVSKGCFDMETIMGVKHMPIPNPPQAGLLPG
jgi:hypothetical protein